MMVRALRKLVFNTSKGPVVVESGQTCRPADPIKLINAGLVEPLNLQLNHEDVEDIFKLLRMPLSQFKDGNYLIRVKCKYLGGKEIFIASGERELAIGKSEGLITYLPDELIQLIRAKATPEEVKAVHKVKQTFNARLQDVREIKDVQKVKGR